MTASWLSTTLDAPSEGGGNSLLPPGVQNVTITDAVAGENQYNGRNEVTLRISGAKTTIPLEPWDANKIDQFLKMFNNGLGNIGIETQGKTAQQVLGTLPQDLPGVIGNVIEVNVVHSDRKPKPDGSHLKDDGTPWTDQKVYINRLVSRGTGAAPATAGAANPDAAALDAAFAAATTNDLGDDNVPF